MMKNKTVTKSNKMWRKVVVFFATFFCLLFIFSSCKKKNTSPTGTDILPPDAIMNSIVVDSFHIATYTVVEDSVVTMHPEFNLIGSYNDAIFGPVEASFYTQLTLSGFLPDFGDLTKVTIDSAVMAFKFGGLYGNVSQQQFEIYEITADLSADSAYKSASTLPIGTQNIIAQGQGLITPDPYDPAIVGDDTLDPQLRIPIDTNFARHLMTLAEGATNDETFLADFKGLYFTVNNSSFLPGEGGIFYLESAAPESKLTIYYKDENGDKEKFDFIITNSAVDFNHIETNFAGTPVEQVINNHSLGQQEYYAQSFTTRAKIDFQSIKNLPKDIIIHKAILELPVNYYTGNKFAPAAEINVSANLFENDDKKYRISTVNYDKTSMAYNIDLRLYIQKVLSGEIQNTGIYVSPRRYNTTMTRIVFNGAQSPYKKQPKLTIVYTKL